jgi:hypothetical protein
MSLTAHGLTPHRCAVFSYHSGERHGWECTCLDCECGGVGFYTLAAATTAAHSHETTTWGRP